MKKRTIGKTLSRAAIVFLAVATGCAGGRNGAAPPGKQEKGKDEWTRIEAALVASPADRAAHVRFLAWLQKQENPDKTEIANEKLILDACKGVFPRDWAPHMRSLGSVLNHQSWHLIKNNKRFAVAEALVRKALELDGDECDYLDTLAELQYRRGEYAKAVETIRRALARKTDRGRPMGRGKRSYLEGQLKRFQEALEKEKKKGEKK